MSGTAADTLSEILSHRFGLQNFRLGQREILASVQQRKDTLAVMPTGGGKSLCYQLPVYFGKGIVVVVSPLISLMQDQTMQLKARGIPSGCLHSGQSYAEKKTVFRELAAAENFLLYVSPERVQKEGFAEWVRRTQIALFAIDEAHCVSQWGPDFRKDYYRLKILREVRPEVPILALTATATPQVLFDISKQLGLSDPDKHVYGFYRPNLYYQVEHCEDEKEKLDTLESALRQFSSGRVLVYCGTRKQTESLAESFSRQFEGVGFYHAGMSAEERSQVQDRFSQSKIRILFATNAFGMGVDFPDVRLVVHFQMPANIESYYQEIGRAGRDGLDSTCLLLYTRKDKGLHAFFIQSAEIEPEIARRRWRALDTIVQFAEGAECRHSGILTYFRDTQRIKACGHCDSCDPASARRVKVVFVPKVVVKKRGSKAAKGALEDTALSAEEKVVAEELRQWRKAYADDKDIPAFVVFSDKTLRDLVRKRPRNLSELAAVYGFGPHKVEHLGPDLLDCLRRTDP